MGSRRARVVDNSVRNSRDVIIALVAEWFLDDKWIKKAQIAKLENKPFNIQIINSGAWYFAYDHYKNVIYVKIPE